ncbi:hypothetical protein [Curtobacterium pusillum]|uniref:hypothetical protein n=1 Tax=Curtobacterium pusillum TaxID=69373 RepID=UPI0011A6A7F6|nr:hypothetical protein [Curtobacterium pusillum]
MSPLVARCVLVGAAIVLAVVGVLAPVAGAPRAVVFGAAVCCALLDVLLVRGGAQDRGDAERVAVVVRPPPLPGSPLTGPLLPVPTLVGPGASGVVVLGATPDGRPAELGLDRPVHVVVVGCGALAVAVFHAVGEQLRARATPAGAHAHARGRTTATADLPDVREAGAPDVASPPAPDAGTLPAPDAGTLPAPDAGTLPAPDPGSPPTPRPPMPPGTAVLAAIPPDGSEPTTVVLVPGTGTIPCRWDAVVEVTRYGCALRRPDDDRATAIAPVLPQLGERG